MSVVARLTCHAVEETVFGFTYKLQPVIPQDDPHEKEIKEFFAATPAGSVQISRPLDDPLDMKPKQQFYLYLEEKGDSKPLVVRAVSLDGWATRVTLLSKEDPPHYASSIKMEFTINNERAAEQFQPLAQFYMRLYCVPDASQN